MKQKKILVFGGGDNQIPLIEACKALGFYTLLTDPDPTAPGAALADLFVALPPKDVEAHRKLICREKVQGIVTCQMENPLPLMASLAEEFDFRFPNPKVIQRARNKYLMKQAFLQHGIPCARGLLIEGEEYLHSINFDEWLFPLIIKPVDSFSSRGVFRVTNKDELFSFYRESVRFSTTRQVLVEEFLTGPEVSVESVTYKGKTKVVQITDKVITPYPYTVELAHFQPSSLPAEAKTAITQLVERAIKAIGLEDGGSHAELKYTTAGPKMIEIGARLGGDYISSYLTLLSTGVDMNRAIAQVAMGELPDLTPRHQKYACVHYINWESEREVAEVLPLTPFLQNPNVAHASIFIKRGDILPVVTDSAKRHAFFITSADSKSELLEQIEHLSQEMMQLVVLK